MSEHKEKSEDKHEVTKSPEDPTIKELIKKTVSWARTQMARLPGLGWLKPKLDPNKSHHAEEGHGHAEAAGGHDVAHGDGSGGGHDAAPSTATPTHAPKESKEKHADKLHLTVLGECDSEGKYIGMSEVERDKLGVKEKDHVELFDKDNKSLGVFTVGKIKMELLEGKTDEEKLSICTANVPKGVEKITVKKTDKKPDAKPADKADGHAPEHAKAA